MRPHAIVLLPKGLTAKDDFEPSRITLAAMAVINVCVLLPLVKWTPRQQDFLKSKSSQASLPSEQGAQQKVAVILSKHHRREPVTSRSRAGV